MTRTYIAEATVRLGDVGRDRRLRFTALARYLQDIAHDDMVDAGLGGVGAWVLRRLELDVTRLARFGEQVHLETTCTGVGPRWAERITTVRGERGERAARIDARALWVFVDAASGRAVALPDEFHERFPVPDDRRRVGIRLQHPAPTPSLARRPWPLRVGDFDVMGHMNNAAYWEPVDEVLATLGRPRVRRAEIEHRAAIEPDDAVVVRVDPGGDGAPVGVWLECDGDVRGSVRLWLDPDGRRAEPPPG